MVTISVPASWGYAPGPITIPIPKGITGNPGSDAELIVIVDHLVYSFWVFSRIDDNNATAMAYGRADIVSDTGWGRVFPALGAGIVAAGSSVLAGMINQAETDAGEINHALQISLFNTLQQPGFVSPAISGDGNSSTGIAKEGQLLAIPLGTTMPNGLSSLGQKVFRCLQNYGAYDIDTAGTTNFRAQTNAYGQATIDALRSDVQVLIPLLQRVN